jgi:ribonuclease BN (tRNA processing enzyme)
VELRLLGSGGWVPTPRRLTSCVYVREGDQVLLLDAGMGVGRLFDEPALLEGVSRLDVLLTHWHLDHVAGLGFLTLHDAGLRPTVWAGGTAVMGMPAAELLGTVFGPPFFSRSAEAARARFEDVREVEEGEVEIGAFALRLRVQHRHSTPTLAVRYGDVFALCTDTGYDEGNVEFARGVDVLLHEAVYAADRCPDEWHSASGDAARIAAAAGVGRLVLVHIDPGLADEDELERRARVHFAATEAGRDGPLLVEAFAK